MHLLSMRQFIKKALIIGAVLTVVLSATVFYVVYAQSDEAKYQNNIRLGNMYLENGDYLMAMNYFDEAARFNAKLVTEYLAVYRGFRSLNNITRAREAIEKAYDSALKTSPERLDEVRAEFAAFLVEIYETEYKPKKDFQGALDWFGDWPYKLNDATLMDKYNEALRLLLEEQERRKLAEVTPTPTSRPTLTPIPVVTATPEPAPEESGEPSPLPTAGTASVANRNNNTSRPVVITLPTPKPVLIPTPTPKPYAPGTTTGGSTTKPTNRPSDGGGGGGGGLTKPPSTKTPPPPTVTPPKTDKPKSSARPIVLGTYSYVISNPGEKSVTLRCYNDIYFQVAVYDKNGDAVSYASSGKGSFTVKAGGETVVSFIDGDIDSTKRTSKAWDSVTYEDANDNALIAADLPVGGTYSFINNTGKSQTVRFQADNRCYYVNYKQNGTISSYSARGRTSVTVPPYGTSVVTITEGGGTVYIPRRLEHCVDVTYSGAGLMVHEMSANTTYTVDNRGEQPLRVTMSNAFEVNTYTAKYYNAAGTLVSEERVRGKGIYVLGGGWTEVTIGGYGLVFCHPPDWPVQVR